MTTKTKKLRIKRLALALSISLIPLVGARAAFFNPASPIFKSAPWQVCFTPGQDCTALLVNAIAHTKQSILVQAYSFTSTPIAEALAEAANRGVKVLVILDKSQFKSERYSLSHFLVNAHIPVWIDYKPAIAHNKVMVLDGKEVVTGSFNFTLAAQKRNAENLLIIEDKNLASTYASNWHKRLAASQPFDSYKPPIRKKREKQG